MKYFIHSAEIPRKLALRYQKPINDATKAWDNFKGKTKVQESLIATQKYLCPYCEIELARGEGEIGYHIEHIEPKSKNPSRTFDFSNLLVSCFNEGDEISPSDLDRKPISCGHAKKSRFDPLLFIKPTDPDCETYFFYELDGRITANPGLNDPEKLAQVDYTITVLNLNCRRLKRERKDLIVEGFNIVNDLSGNQEALSYFANGELDEVNGKNRPFFTTRQQYFQPFTRGRQ